MKILGNNSIRSLMRLIQKKFKEIEGNLDQTFTELNSSISTHIHNTASYTNNGFLASVDKIKIDSIVKCGLVVTSLNELVESIMGQSQGQFRTSQGTISIPNGILSFINETSGSWCQFYASWQNHYSNTQYDINMNILIITSSTGINPPYMVHIEGNNGSYHVVSEESLLPITKTEVNELKKSVSDGKTAVANAITAKGVTTAANAEFETIATNIGKIKTPPNLQSKSAVLSNVAQTIKADTGYDGLSQVSVPAVKGTAVVGNVLTGKTFSGAAGIEKAGTMVNNGAVTVDAKAVTQDDTYTYLAVPSAAFYNANSKIRTKNSNIRVKKVLLGSVHSIANKTFNLTSYPGWQNFTDNNFGFSAPTETYMGQSVSGETHGQYSYNSSNGVLTVYKNHRATTEVAGITNVYYVYLYYVSSE